MLISIITINYNDKEGLVKTISSVTKFASDCIHDVEYIIIDGDSSDGSINIISDINTSDFYDFSFTSERDSGIYDAMNKGLDRISENSDYVLFMNSGDTFLNNAGSIIGNESFQHDILIYGIQSRDHDGELMSLRRIKGINDIESWPCFPHQSTFISSEYHRNNKYSTKYKILSDYNFFCRAYSNEISIRLSKKIISEFDQGGVSSNTEYLDVFISELKEIQVEYFGKYNKIIVLSLHLKGLLRSSPIFTNAEKYIRQLLFKR